MEDSEEPSEPPAKRQKTGGLFEDSDDEEDAQEAGESVVRKEETDIKEDDNGADGEKDPQHTTSGFDDADQQEGYESGHYCLQFLKFIPHHNRDHWSGLTFEEREKLGFQVSFEKQSESGNCEPKMGMAFQVKRIIDIGRARYLESLGLKVDLVYYVDRGTSLENLLLLASR